MADDKTTIGENEPQEPNLPPDGQAPASAPEAGAVEAAEAGRVGPDGMDHRSTEEILTDLRERIATDAVPLDSNGQFMFACNRPNPMRGDGPCSWGIHTSNTESLEPNVVGHMANEHANG